jgi:hypothetical protein
MDDEAVVAYPRYCSGIFMEDLKKPTRNLGHDSRCPVRELKQSPPDYKSATLPLHQPTRGWLHRIWSAQWWRLPWHGVRTKSHNSSSNGPDVTGRRAHWHDDTFSVYWLDNSGNVHSNGEHILLLPTDTDDHSLHLQISYSRVSVVIFCVRFNVLTEVNGGRR